MGLLYIPAAGKSLFRCYWPYSQLTICLIFRALFPKCTTEHQSWLINSLYAYKNIYTFHRSNLWMSSDNSMPCVNWKVVIACKFCFQSARSCNNYCPHDFYTLAVYHPQPAHLLCGTLSCIVEGRGSGSATGHVNQPSPFCSTCQGLHCPTAILCWLYVCVDEWQWLVSNRNILTIKYPLRCAV